MRALCFHSPHQVGVETCPDPRIEAPADVLLRVSHAAICGSDLHVYLGRETGLDPGTVLGHEFVGEVVEAGPESGWRRGQLVVAPFSTACGRCWYCLRYLSARCPQGQLFGWVQRGHGLQGGQAELVRVPLAATSLVAVPEGLEPELALLAGDVLSTGRYAAELAGVGPGTLALVLGCGPVGLMAVAACRERAAERVYALDRQPERLELAAAFGATPIDPRREDPLETLRSVSQGRGADAVIEAAGGPEATRLACELARPGGCVAAVAVHTEPQLAVTPAALYDKNLSYRAGRCPARSYLEGSLELLERRRHPFARIWSHRLPLSQAPQGYQLFSERQQGCTKVLLEVAG